MIPCRGGFETRPRTTEERKGQKHIREADVIAAGKSVGLTDNKVCRFSDTHTALRFVIPLARR
ncbi:MAG: hypothetical protein WB559_08275 [Candidatus Acidiferrales bacterium]